MTDAEVLDETRPRSDQMRRPLGVRRVQAVQRIRGELVCPTEELGFNNVAFFERELRIAIEALSPIRSPLGPQVYKRPFGMGVSTQTASGLPQQPNVSDKRQECSGGCAAGSFTRSDRAAIIQPL